MHKTESLDQADTTQVIEVSELPHVKDNQGNLYGGGLSATIRCVSIAEAQTEIPNPDLIAKPGTRDDRMGSTLWYRFGSLVATSLLLVGCGSTIAPSNPTAAATQGINQTAQPQVPSTNPIQGPQITPATETPSQPQSENIPFGNVERISEPSGLETEMFKPYYNALPTLDERIGISELREALKASNLPILNYTVTKEGERMIATTDDGSIVLANINGKSYLVTVSHVVEREGENMTLATPNGNMYKLPRKAFKSENVDELSLIDLKDGVSYLEITPELVKDMGLIPVNMDTTYYPDKEIYPGYYFQYRKPNPVIINTSYRLSGNIGSSFLLDTAAFKVNVDDQTYCNGNSGSANGVVMNPDGSYSVHALLSSIAAKGQAIVGNSGREIKCGPGIVISGSRIGAMIKGK